MIKDPVAEAVAQAWDQVIDRARRQGPEALRKAELLRRRADLMRDHAFPAVVAAEIYQIDLKIENQPDTDATLSGRVGSGPPLPGPDGGVPSPGGRFRGPQRGQQQHLGPGRVPLPRELGLHDAGGPKEVPLRLRTAHGHAHHPPPLRV